MAEQLKLWHLGAYDTVSSFEYVAPDGIRLHQPCIDEEDILQEYRYLCENQEVNKAKRQKKKTDKVIEWIL